MFSIASVSYDTMFIAQPCIKKKESRKVKIKCEGNLYYHITFNVET